MKKFRITLLLLLIMVFVTSVTSCKKTSKDDVKNYNDTIVENVKSSKKVNQTITIKDSDVIVYEQLKELTIIDENKAVVVFTTTTLDDNIEFATSKTTENIENLKTTDLFNLTLEKNLFKSYTLKDNNFNAEITKENVSKVFNSDIKVKDIAILSIGFENSKIKRIECTYETESGRLVNLCTIYEY